VCEGAAPTFKQSGDLGSNMFSFVEYK
jgi:hypothetical protein